MTWSRAILASLTLAFAPAAASRLWADETPLAGDALASPARELWLGTEGRFVRQWLLLGPVRGAAAESARQVEPKADTDVQLPDGAVVRWRAYTSWADVGNGFESTPLEPGDVALAHTTVARDHDGDAILSVGGNVRALWVHGAPVALPQAPPAFVIDGTQVRVALKEGPNRILLELVRRERSPLFALRVVEPGFPIKTSGQVAPYVAESSASMLRVALAARPIADGTPVLHEVVGAGGRVLAQATLDRATDARFDPIAWPDGAYEVRVTTKDRRGEETIAHVPWYKGDAGAAARRLLERAHANPSDGHVAMLADLVRDRLGKSEPSAGSWPLLHSPLLEWEELERERAGRTGGDRASGFVRLAWTDDVDGSTQFCRVYLPSRYPGSATTDGATPGKATPSAATPGGMASGGRRWPAVVWLHGYHPENPPYVRWWSIADRHNGVAERQGTIVLEPFGRGNVDYRWIGERDVLRCLAEARRRFPIDEDRVSLGGESMGGNGTWLIASRHPQLFASAAPVFGGWDYRVSPGWFTNPRATRRYERFAAEVQSSFASAEGLRNVPLLVVHGDQDAAVPVEQSRHVTRLLQRWGYDLRYHEVPGRAHEELNLRDPIAAWLLGHRRVRDPREVRLRAIDLAGATAHWLAVTGRHEPLAMIEARAEVVAPGWIRLETRNVATAVLAPPPALAGDGSTVRVVWNGEERAVPREPDGSLRLVAAGVDPRPGDKGPAMEGGLSNLFGTPFAIVVGTASADAEMNRLAREKAQALAGLWQGWQHTAPRLLRDTEVTAEHERRFSLLLVGGPRENRVAARLAGRLPFTVARDAVTIDGRRFPATDAVAQVLRPSPSQPERYVLVVAPTSLAGLRAWDPGGFWVQENGYQRLPWDFTIVDGRRVKLEEGLGPERGWIAAGVFDRHWRRDDRWVFTADESPAP